MKVFVKKMSYFPVEGGCLIWILEENHNIITYNGFFLNYQVLLIFNIQLMYAFIIYAVDVKTRTYHYLLMIMNYFIISH